MSTQNNPQFPISATPTREEIKEIQERVEGHKRQQTQGEIDKPGIEIQLSLKDSHHTVQGGVIASTVFHVMHLEVLWVAEEYRRLGYGGKLVLGAEAIGFQKGCSSAQTWTFAFQGPEFYPTIGYEQLGVYDGYPDGLTEHVFLKRLSPHQRKDSQKRMKLGEPDQRGFTLSDQVSEADLKILHEGLHSHVVAQVGDGHRGIRIELVVKDAEKLIGGLFAWTTLCNMILEYIWIDEGYRNQGLGQKLIREAERIARENCCIASQTYSFSFQAPGFLEKMGYQVLGISDGYPPPVKEFYLIKKYHP